MSSTLSAQAWCNFNSDRTDYIYIYIFMYVYIHRAARAGGEEIRMAFLLSNLDISFKSVVQQQ